MREVITRRRGVGMAALLATVSVASACSGMGSEDGSSSGDSGGQGKTTITVAYIPDPSPMTAYLEGEVKRFEEKNPDTAVKLLSVPSKQYANAIELQFGQGNAPDVFRLQPENQFAERALSRGWLRDLNTYAHADFRKRFPDGTFETSGGMIRNDKLISIPLNDGRWTGTRALFYNPKLLSQYGYSKPPSTWDEMSAVATKISRESDGKVYGFGLNQLWSRVEEHAWSSGDPLMKSADGAGLNPRTGRAAYSQDNYTKGVEYYQRLVAERAVAPGWQNFGGQDLWPLFVNGQVAMYIGFVWNYPELVKLKPDFEVGVAPIPSKDGSTPRIYSQSSNVPYWAISSKSERPDQAWSFIDFLSTKESQTRFYAATGAPPALTHSIEDQIDQGVLKVLEIAQESRIVAPDAKLASPEGQQITQRLADKVKPADLRDVLANAVGKNQPWAPIGQQLDSKLNTAIDQVIAELKAEGVTASRDNLVFADWNPDSDYKG